MLGRFAFLIATASVISASSACGGSTATVGQGSSDGGGSSPGDGATPHDAGGSSADGGGQSTDAGSPTDGGTTSDAPAAACALDPSKGSFTFHVHNGGSRSLTLALGCGRSLPIQIQTATGELPAGPGPEDTCEFTCDDVYAGHSQPGACSDCGPGVASALGPGATVDVTWDRRAYTERAVDLSCTTGTGSCAWGASVAPAASQAGVLTVCTSATGFPGSCSTSDTVAFTVDTTKGEATIEVK
jgi:hypothetical protein